MNHYYLADLHTEEPHFVRIAYPSLTEMWQEHFVEGIFYSFRVVNQVFVHWLFFILLSVQYVRKRLTSVMLGLPLWGRLEHFVAHIRRLLNYFL